MESRAEYEVRSTEPCFAEERDLAPAKVRHRFTYRHVCMLI
jgi:hypothetical protein